jgi:hypothetical protein
MPGEKDLDVLLSTMSPTLAADEFVFASFPLAQYGDHPELSPIATVVEREGLTLVVPRDLADATGLDYASAFRKITLEVHSSLDAVGLTAAVSARLTEHGISANVVAGYFHDHVFVQTEVADEALAAVRALAVGEER